MPIGPISHLLGPCPVIILPGFKGFELLGGLTDPLGVGVGMGGKRLIRAVMSQNGKISSVETNSSVETSVRPPVVLLVRLTKQIKQVRI